MRKIQSKRVWRLLLWGVAAVLGVNLGRLVYHGVSPFKAQAASALPYTVLRTENAFDKDGNLQYMNQYIDAVRTDGSRMRRSSTPVVQQRRIYFANGDYVVTNEILARKSTYPKKYSTAPGRRDPSASCYSNELDGANGWVIDGTESVSGHPTVRLSYTKSGRSWKIWYALDVGCAVLQMRYEQDNAVTVQNLTSLNIGEPDSSLFQVSSALQEGPPSGLYDRICKDGKCTAPLPDDRKQKLDNDYFNLRAQAH